MTLKSSDADVRLHPPGNGGSSMGRRSSVRRSSTCMSIWTRRSSLRFGYA